MKKILFLSLLFIAGLVGYNHVEADTIICNDTADVYIDQRYPDESFNDKTRLLVSWHPTYGIARSLLKFDIPISVEAAQIQSAILHLSSSGHTGGSSVVVNINCHALNASFDESTVTWNSLSGGDYDASIFSSGSLPIGNEWRTTIDVTNLLAENLNKVRDNGILLKLAIEGPDKLYNNIASRECDNISNPDYVDADEPPSLEIIYAASSSTTTTILTTTTIPTTSITSTSTVPVLTTTTTAPSSTTTTILTTTTIPTTSITSTSTVPVLTTTTSAPQTSSTSSTTSSTSTTTTSTLCPVVQMFKDEKSHEVQVIRKFRNRRMTKSFTGIVLIYLYYANTEELTNILSSNPELANGAAILIRELVPGAALSLEHSSSIILTQWQYHEIVNILSNIRKEASPKLRNTIDYTLKQLESGQIFEILRITIE